MNLVQADVAGLAGQKSPKSPPASASPALEL